MAVFIAKLASLDGERKMIFFRRQRARGIRCERARRVVSTIEIEDYFAIYYRIAVQKSATRISLSFAG